MSGRAFIGALVALAIGGCAMVGPDYRRPEIELPGDYPEPGVAQKNALPAVPADWWKLYGDATLDQLVATGLARNTDVRIAVARIEEAEAVLREAGATLLPELDVRGAAGRSRSRLGTQSNGQAASPVVRNNFLVAGNTSFELDFWGRLRRLREAARAQYLASRFGRDVVALSLASRIAQSYFLVRSLDAQIEVSQETLNAAGASVDIAQKRAGAGLVPELDVHQARANRAQLAAQIKELQRLRAAATHQLGVVLGKPDLSLPPGTLSSLPAPPLPPAGMPSALLERRPDVRQAEANLMAASAQIGVARAAQFPTITLTAELGLQSSQLSNLVSSGAGIWSVGLGALGPVLDWGRYAARTEQAEARARQAAIAYEQTVLKAFGEVADALSNVRLSADAEADLRTRVEEARKSLQLSTQRYQSGYSAYLEVLDAQRTLNDAQLALARNRQQFLGFTVDFMNALGGGWGHG